MPLRRPAWALALAAPLVAEFVSGNLPIVYLWLLVIYVPLYGGAAVLIREVGRRSRRPWSVILLLGLAYGVVEEAFVSFSLFNPDYADLRLLDFGWVEALGIGAWWTVFVVVLHAVWSVAVPIVLVEAFAGDRAEAPWLTRRGLAGPTLAILVGAGLALAATLAEDDFLPSRGQLLGAAVAVAALVTAAVLVSRDPAGPRRRPDDGPAPSLRRLVAFSAAVALAFVAGAAQVGPPGVTMAAYLLIGVGLVARLARWSTAADWDGRHRLALATGALVVHVGFALLQGPLVDVPRWVAVGGDVVFAAGTLFVLREAWRRQLALLRVVAVAD